MKTPQFLSALSLLALAACGTSQTSLSKNSNTEPVARSGERGVAEDFDRIHCYDLKISPADPERLFSPANAFVLAKRGPGTFLVSTPGAKPAALVRLDREVRGNESVYTWIRDEREPSPALWLSTEISAGEGSVVHDGVRYEVIQYVEEGDMAGFCLIHPEERHMLRAVSAE